MWYNIKKFQESEEVEMVSGKCISELADKIIGIEWEMFSAVKNIGGRAFCQDDPATFKIMRSSQYAAWSKETLESYLNDLEEAKKWGRSLPAEKYGRMMRWTSPSEYAQISHLLPPLEPGVRPLINKIVEIELEWMEELYKEYPNVLGRGRPIRRSQESQFVTSAETYLRGELETYSKKTLELYYKGILDKKSQNINGAERTYENMVRQYGYKSLEEANQVEGSGIG
jgi:hypothetical protein